MITNSRLFVVNSRNRESGNHSNFTFKIPLDNNDYTHCCVMQASIPKSFYLIETGWNTFTLEEGITQTTITLTPGNYTVNSLMTELTTQLNAASLNTFTVSYPSSTLPDTGKLTFTVSSGNPKFIFSDYCYELLGFEPDSENTFSGSSLTSTNVIKVQVEDTLTIRSDICNNGGINNVLQEIYANASVDFSSITYQCNSLEGCSKPLNSKDSNLFHFYLTNEDEQIIDTNGVNINFTILVYKKNNIFDKLQNFINYFVSKY